jgi:hypothetical protein
MACVDLDNTISSWTPLAMKINDLYSFGQGGDACSMTRSNAASQEDDEDGDALHVIAVDTGTWPNEVSRLLTVLALNSNANEIKKRAAACLRVEATS